MKEKHQQELMEKELYLDQEELQALDKIRTVSLSKFIAHLFYMYEIVRKTKQCKQKLLSVLQLVILY